jgi:hypothetical protein
MFSWAFSADKVKGVPSFVILAIDFDPALKQQFNNFR